MRKKLSNIIFTNVKDDKKSNNICVLFCITIIDLYKITSCPLFFITKQFKISENISSAQHHDANLTLKSIQKFKIHE